MSASLASVRHGCVESEQRTDVRLVGGGCAALRLARSKTAMVLALCRLFRNQYSIAAVRTHFLSY